MRQLTLPIELVDEIVQASLENGAIEAPLGLSDKPPWMSVSSLSLTCKAYRKLVLKAWFHCLYAKDSKDTTEFIAMSQFEKKWVKRIHCVYSDTENHTLTPWNLEGYSRLETVRLDWIMPNNREMYSDHVPLPFLNASSTVVQFELRGHYWSYPNNFRFIPPCFPCIKTLILYQTDVWCDLCFTINQVLFAEPLSERFKYDGGFGLPIHYAKVLEPLSSLEHVSIYLPVLDWGSTKATGLIQEIMWTGECDSCRKLLLASSSFANDYTSRKRQGIVRLANGTEQKSQRPPSLKSVEWILLAATEDNDWDPFQFSPKFLEMVHNVSGVDSGEGHA